MKYHVKYYDERRNLIGGDEWHAPPGTSYVTIGMEVLPEGPSPVAGYQLTGEELVAALDASEQRTQAHQRHVSAATHGDGEWPTEPAPSQPVFDKDGREVPGGDGESIPAISYPLIGFCRCKRQIIRMGPGNPWQHGD